MATPFPFGAGNVLTAAQLNAITTLPVSTKTASHTLTIADLGTRVVMNSASPTTITVNTSIFSASDVVEIANIGAGVCTITAGSCTVGTTGTLALAQNASGKLFFISTSAAIYDAGGVSGSGLTFISGTTFSGALTASLPTNTFSATYQNYKIKFLISSTHVAGTILSLRLRASGTDSSASSYYGSMFGAQGGTTQYLSNNPANLYQLNYLSATAGRVAGEIDVYAPQEAVSTRFTANIIGTQAGDTVSASTVGGAFFDAATVFDSLTLISSAGNISGNYRVYGYANS